tara:strand:+ start:14 stop:337 length:324 start_codon:yes stop_codon:yes gene_type:complete
MKNKETLEEAATKLLWKKYPYHPPRDSGYWQDMFKEGAKWQSETYHQFTLAMDDLKSSREGYLKAKLEYELKQQERSYSEEEVLTILAKFRELRLIEFQEWFEQFKK